MRTTIVAMLVASGTMIALPALAQQQQPVPNPQMQEEADKGVKTCQSGEFGVCRRAGEAGCFRPPPWED